jgi:hypothetical protein
MSTVQFAVSKRSIAYVAAVKSVKLVVEWLTCQLGTDIGGNDSVIYARHHWFR